MSDVFLDTVGLLALLDIADQWHAAAEVAFQQLKTAGRDFATTELIFLEAGNAAARTRYLKAIGDIRRDMATRGQIVEVTPADLEVAWHNYESDHDNRAGIVDQTSFLVMRRLGLAEAFTNDQHFTAAGFRILF